MGTKAGRSFEELVFRIYSTLLQDNRDAKVALDERIPGPGRKRQVDVSISYNIAGLKYVTMIECKGTSEKPAVFGLIW